MWLMPKKIRSRSGSWLLIFRNAWVYSAEV